MNSQQGHGCTIATGLLTFAVAGAIASLLVGGDAGEAGFALVYVVYAAVGWLVRRSQPANRVAWLLLAFGAIGGCNGAVAAWTSVAEATHLPGASFAAWTETWLWSPLLGVSFGPLLVLFPDGRLLSRRWAVVLWLSAIFTILASVGNAFLPSTGESGEFNPYAIPEAAPVLRVLTDIAGIALMLTLVGGVAALVARFRRASHLQRQQLKWFLFAAAVLPVGVVLGEMNQQAVQPIAVSASLGLLAAAMGIAILRHRLFDIDRIISRTVGWTLVTLVLAGVYLAVVTTLSAATVRVAGDSTLAVAASTLAAAAAFGPVRRRIQAAVDRRFNRARYDAAKTVEAYRGRLRDDLDMDSISEHLQTAVAATLQPASTALWLRTPEVPV